MDEQLQGLIDAIDVSRDKQSIRNAIKKFTVSSGFERFAYIHVHGDDLVAFSDYPAEWQNLYFEKKYAIIDPVVTTAKHSMRMFAWSAEDGKVHKSTREVRRFFSESIDFGIRSGVSIPIKTSYGRTAMISLASDRQKAVIPATWDPIEGALALAHIHILLSLTDIVPLKKGGVTLSTQEATSLSWASYGKSMNVIAELLGIKPRTVQFYLDSARDKLGACNLQQAVRIAMEKKLI